MILKFLDHLRTVANMVVDHGVLMSLALGHSATLDGEIKKMANGP